MSKLTAKDLSLFLGGFIVGVLLLATVISGRNISNDYQVKIFTAEIEIGRYNDDVKENVSILNGDELLEGTELLLRFTDLNDSRQYVLINGLEEYGVVFHYVFSNGSVQDITIVIDITIQSINLCAYDFHLNGTSWEIFSYTIHFLIMIRLGWSSN